jgi:hypothetical protein
LTQVNAGAVIAGNVKLPRFQVGMRFRQDLHHGLTALVQALGGAH